MQTCSTFNPYFHSLPTYRLACQELDKVVRVLLQKTGESSGFIREDVERTLCEMVQHATPGKVLLSIITGGLK